MERKIPSFDYSDCLNCGMCAQACPVSCLSMTREGRQGKYRNVFPEMTGGGCIGCGMCAQACPMGCVIMKTPGKFEKTPG